MEDYIDQEKLSSKHADLVLEERMNVDLTEGDDTVYEMLQTLSGGVDNDSDDDEDNDDTDDLLSDDELVELSNGEFSADDFYGEDDGLDDDVEAELTEEEIEANDEQLEKQGLKVSYVKGGQVLEGAEALEAVQKDAANARKKEEIDDMEVLEMVRVGIWAYLKYLYFSSIF